MRYWIACLQVARANAGPTGLEAQVPTIQPRVASKKKPPEGGFVKSPKGRRWNLSKQTVLPTLASFLGSDDSTGGILWSLCALHHPIFMGYCAQRCKKNVKNSRFFDQEVSFARWSEVEAEFQSKPHHWRGSCNARFLDGAKRST